MKFVYLMWALCVFSVLILGLSGWNVILATLSGVIFGMATVMSLVEIQDG